MTQKRSIHRDSTGLTAVQARKEAELHYTRHPKFKHVYQGDQVEATVRPCGGQLVIAGRATTRGCGHAHLQPCPGGSLVYTIARRTTMFRVIEAQGASWREAIDKIAERRAQDRKLFAAAKKARKTA